MREILFKAKRKDNQEWIYGDIIQGYSIETISQYFIVEKESFCECDEYKCLGTSRAFEIIPETVCQYTGLTDKNGAKIFENDILQIKEDMEEEYKAIVKFDDCQFYFELLDEDKWIEDWNLIDDGYRFEVIGNIFDKEVE